MKKIKVEDIVVGDWIFWLDKEDSNKIFEIRIVSEISREGFRESIGHIIEDGNIMENISEPHNDKSVWIGEEFLKSYRIKKLNKKEKEEWKLKIALFEL